MPKFVFQLDGVLRQRTHAEQQRQRELAAAQAQVAQLQAELRALNDSIEASTRSLRRDHLTGRLDMNFLAAHRRYTSAMQRKGQAMAQKMAVFLRSVEAAQQALAEAAKQRKVIEKLRERQKERWLLDAARKEAADLDEIGMQMSYDRRSADGGDFGAAGHTSDELAPSDSDRVRDEPDRAEFLQNATGESGCSLPTQSRANPVPRP